MDKRNTEVINSWRTVFSYGCGTLLGITIASYLGIIEPSAVTLLYLSVAYGLVWLLLTGFKSIL